MKYNFDFKVQYEEVDETRHLRLYNLEEYLLNVAGQAADLLGFGTFDLLPHNLTWILAHLSVEMQYLPIHGEEIRIETWIEENAHMLSRRDYRIYLTKAHDHELGYIGKAVAISAVSHNTVTLYPTPISITMATATHASTCRPCSTLSA